MLDEGIITRNEEETGTRIRKKTVRTLHFEALLYFFWLLAQ